jgi:hypothetical protein
MMSCYSLIDKLTCLYSVCTSEVLEVLIVEIYVRLRFS